MQKNDSNTLTLKIKYLFLGLAFFFCYFISYGEQNKIDSLRTLLRSDIEDTNKVKHLNGLAWELKNGKLDSAITLSEQALSLSQKITSFSRNNKGWQKGVAKSLSNMGIFYYIKGDYPKALKYQTQALNINKDINYKMGMAVDLGRVGNIYWAQNDYPKALDNYFSALNIYVEIKDKKGIANSFGSIGLIYYNHSDYFKALEYYVKALEMCKEIDNKTGIGKTLGLIGAIYFEQGNYTKSIEYFINALKIEEELGDKTEIPSLLNNLGSIYIRQKDYSKGLGYLSRALKMAEESGNIREQISFKGNFGSIYLELKKYDEAKKYLLETLQMAEVIGDKSSMAALQGNIGQFYASQKNYTDGLVYFLKAYKISEELGDKSSMASNLGNIGTLYTDTKKFKEAEKCLLDAAKLDKEIGALEGEKNIQEALSSLYASTNRHKLALEHYKAAMVLRDSIFNEEKSKEITRKEMNYEFDKKEAVERAEHKNELEKQSAIAEEKNRKQKIITWSVVVGLLFVVVFAGFVFRSLHVTRKQKEIIEVQKLEVEKSKYIIEEKNKNITDSINYAKRIQQAKLPSKELIYSSLPHCFVLFKPKDIVSGDFYFFHKNGNSIFIASADCTGHGVPGALMSMIGSEQLNDALADSSDTSEILKHLNKGVKNSLHQTDGNESTRDGMDIALCSIDADARVVKYTGANRPIWIIRSGQTLVEEIKGTKKAIGGFTEDSQHFDSHEIQFEKGDTFYISTDGFADTFGGAEQKKVTTKRFKEILVSIQDKTMKEQEQHLDSFIENWKGGTEQIDDILVIGVRL